MALSSFGGIGEANSCIYWLRYRDGLSEEDAVPSSSHFDHVVEASAAESLTEMIMAYRLSQLIHVAARLGVADLLKSGGRSCGRTASRAGGRPHGPFPAVRRPRGNGLLWGAGGSGLRPQPPSRA